MNDHGFRRFLLIVLLLLALGSTAPAEAPARPRVAVELCRAPATPVFADRGSLSKFLTGGGRTRVVQICVVTMCIALFIMMRK